MNHTCLLTLEYEYEYLLMYHNWAECLLKEYFCLLVHEVDECKVLQKEEIKYWVDFELNVLTKVM